jgi:NAD(P)-dependent dehydrogenase (short-subunit alcohol dehydrogenase family)
MSQTIETVTKRTAIITGGSRGMGRNTAVNLARRGVDVIFTYHSNQTEAESLIREIEAMGGKAAAYRLDTGALAHSTSSSRVSAKRSKAGDVNGSITS